MRHRVSREPRVHIALHTNTRVHATPATPGVACVLILQRTASHYNTLQRVLQCIQCAHNILEGVACVLTLQRTVFSVHTTF